MKKFLVFLALSFVIVLPFFAQTVVENPEKPLNEEAGRILELREVLRITDEAGDFYFQYPRFLKVAPDGTLFLYDQEELLRFDRNGKFLHNYYKKGQGPGELNYVRNYTFQEDRLIVHSTNPNKIVWFDFAGELVKDQRIFDIPGALRFQLINDGTYYFWKFEFPAREGKPTIVDIPQVLVAVDQKGKEIEDLVSFPIKSYVMGGAMVQYSTLKSVPYKNRFIFISHTREYSVKLFDTRSKKLLRTFNRAYQRIKTPDGHQEAAIIIEGKRYGPEQEKFLNDIDNLFVFDDRLWVLTTTKDSKNRLLIDVFDFEGRFIDSFFLGISGILMATHQDRLFVREKDPDELIHLVEYKVTD